MIRFALVGCGAIHATHAEALAQVEGGELAAVVDVVPERARAAGERWGVHAFTRLALALEHVDAVSVCTPSGLHAKVGLAAARAGKHVLVEKPIDTTRAKAERLVAGCREAGVKLASVSQHRFARDVQRLKHLVAQGAFGRMVGGEAHVKWYRTQAYYDSGDWRGTWALDGGGCLINQSIHTIDVLQFIMGPVRAVWAQTRTAAHTIEVEDVAHAIVEFESGATGIIHCTTCAYPGFRERVEVNGVHGSAILEGDRIVCHESDPAAPASSSPYGRDLKYHPLPTHTMFDNRPSDEPDPTTRWDMQHRMQIQDFVDAIRADREPFVRGEDGLEPLRVILAIYRSARAGGRRTVV